MCIVRTSIAVSVSIFALAAAARADLMADSPVKFPEKGALKSKYPPDRPTKQRETPEEGYSIFASPERSLEQIDTIQAEMAKGEFTPPKADWANLPRTRRILTAGGELHLMGIGDSIVADTMRSAWLAKLAQAYPKATIRGTVYVRGGGGCQHYKIEDRIAKNVVPRKPDLVFLGGISQQDIDSIREVIKQLRAGLPDVEILLATGPFGSKDPRTGVENEKGAAEAAAYSRELAKLATAEKCAFLDLRAPWVEYIRSAKVHPHLFYRDRVHANEFGEQILTKILLSFFRDDAPLSGNPRAK